MSTEEHAEIARDLLLHADTPEMRHESDLFVNMAQARATLAIAHELRIANLVAILEATRHPVDIEHIHRLNDAITDYITTATQPQDAT